MNIYETISLLGQSHLFVSYVVSARKHKRKDEPRVRSLVGLLRCILEQDTLSLIAPLYPGAKWVQQQFQLPGCVISWVIVRVCGVLLATIGPWDS